MGAEKNKTSEAGGLNSGDENKEQHFPEDSDAPKQVDSAEPEVGGHKQQATENMEVHHYSSRTSGRKKNWKSYFWEFLMLFLAVFCGFLAEYYLEHRIEKERGKQFIESFYEDLKKDTARITFYTGFDEEKIKGLNNLGSCYDAIFKNVNDAWCLNDVIKYTAINRPFMYRQNIKATCQCRRVSPTEKGRCRQHSFVRQRFQ